VRVSAVYAHLLSKKIWQNRFPDYLCNPLLKKGVVLYHYGEKNPKKSLRKNQKNLVDRNTVLSSPPVQQNGSSLKQKHLLKKQKI
jgi:hypothetical protein